MISIMVSADCQFTRIPYVCVYYMGHYTTINFNYLLNRINLALKIIDCRLTN